jgi:TRAP-type C4-dicarboxylate transport system substrate-binding protein
MGLKQGVIDGQENPLEVFYSSNLQEIQKYVMRTEHLLSCYFVCVGDYFYEKFDETEQKILKEAIAEASQYQNDLMIEYEAKYISELLKPGVEFIDVDKEAFEKLALEKLPNILPNDWAIIYQRIRDVK